MGKFSKILPRKVEFGHVTQANFGYCRFMIFRPSFPPKVKRSPQNGLKKQGSGLCVRHCRGSRRQGSFSTFASSAQTTDGTGLEEISIFLIKKKHSLVECSYGKKRGKGTFLVLAFELLNEVVYKTVIEIFTTKMGITSSGLDLDDTLIVRR